MDHYSRLGKKRVWVVDPLDGTREFVWAYPSSAFPSDWWRTGGRWLVESIIRPLKRSSLARLLPASVTYDGKPAHPSQRTSLDDALVLASRREVKRGEWKQFENAPFKIRAMDSVAYKLALVSAGLAEITFALKPKNEWDVAAGAALVQRAGNFVSTPDNTDHTANNRSPLLSGLLAGGPHLKAELFSVLEPHIQSAAAGTKK